jgi:hypothetical protein
LTVPGELLLPGVFMVLALSFDLLQYCIGTVTWFFFYRTKEMQRNVVLGGYATSLSNAACRSTGSMVNISTYCLLDTKITVERR